jgi:hypothetical protein
MNNLFLILNIIGIALYLSLWPVHLALINKDSEEMKSGGRIFKRGRFSTGIMMVYLVFISKFFGWNLLWGWIPGFQTHVIIYQLIFILWNSKSEALYFIAKVGTHMSFRLVIYNAIGIATFIYQIILHYWMN